MSRSHWTFTARMAATPYVVFDLISDLPNYGRWLPGSSAFGATTEVSPYPVRLGSTYLDAGPSGRRPGSVTEYDRPTRIAFHQTMVAKKGPLTANTEVYIRYTFEPVEGATFVTRDVDLRVRIAGLWQIADPLVVAAFRKENARLLPILKRYVEA